MSGTFTTEYQNVNDGETVTVNPQELIPKSGYLNINNAEIQFKGESNTSTSFSSGNRFNRDTGQAEVSTTSFTQSNSDFARTNVTDTRRTVTKTKTEKNNDFSNDVVGATANASKPSIPNDAKNITVTINYYLNEIGGAGDDDIIVEYDDDPFQGSYDRFESNISIGGFSTKRIFSSTINLRRRDNYNFVDGAQAKLFQYEGNRNDGSFSSVNVQAEIIVEYDIESREGNFNRTRNFAVARFPEPNGDTVTEYRLQVRRNGSLVVNNILSRGGDPPNPRIQRSGPNDNDTVRVKCITRSQERSVQRPTLSVQYPFVPSGFSFDNHDIHRDGYGNSFEFISDNREGETVVEKPDVSPSDGTVELELETEFSKTVTTKEDSLNPTVKEDYLKEGFNTDNVLLVTDSSESMASSNRNSVLKDIVQSLPDSTTFSMVSFNFSSTILFDEVSLGNRRSDVNNLIDNDLVSTGGTDISSAIENVEQEFLGDGTSGTVVLVTDGNNFRDAENIELPRVDTSFDFISIGVTDSINDKFLTEFSSLLDGDFIKAPIDDTVVSTRLQDNEITSFKELDGFTSGEQDLTFSVDESEEVKFRLRFDWERESAQPILGTVGFYDESTDNWKEVAVTSVNSNRLEYNHVSVYNEDENEWGALDVVDLSHPVAIEAFQFYDSDAGWLAPRKYETESG